MKKSELKQLIKEAITEGFPVGKLMFTPADLTKTQAAADLVIQALGITDPESSVALNTDTLEEGSFDIDMDGEHSAGGSYTVSGAGIIFIDSLGLKDSPRIGMLGSATPETVAQKIQAAGDAAPKEYDGGRYDDVNEMRHDDAIKDDDGKFLSIGDVVNIEGMDGEYQIVISSGNPPSLLPYTDGKIDKGATPLPFEASKSYSKVKSFSDTDGGFMGEDKKKSCGIKEDEIPGGLGDNSKPSDFCHTEVKMGVKVEREHTDSQQTAMEIALDHLKENPKYYSELAASGIDKH